MWIEGGFVALLIAAWRKAQTRGKISPEAEVMILEMFETLRGPDAARLFREGAEVVERQGHKTYAAAMRRRADWLERPPETVRQHHEAIARAMASYNAEALDGMAKHLEWMTATGLARGLRERAAGIRAGSITKEKEAAAAAAQKAQAEKAASDAKKKAGDAQGGAPETVKKEAPAGAVKVNGAPPVHAAVLSQDSSGSA